MAISKIIYPGTFDPVTLGHEDLVQRASQLFEHVVLGVAGSTTKQTLFSFEERVRLAEQVFEHIPNVRVSGFSGLLMDFAASQGVRLVLRGLRATSDFEYEFQLAGMNRKLHPKIETVFLTPGEQFMFVSSSLVREVAALGGDVRPFVSPLVENAILQKFDTPSKSIGITKWPC